MKKIMRILLLLTVFLLLAWPAGAAGEQQSLSIQVRYKYRSVWYFEKTSNLSTYPVLELQGGENQGGIRSVLWQYYSQQDECWKESQALQGSDIRWLFIWRGLRYRETSYRALVRCGNGQTITVGPVQVNKDFSMRYFDDIESIMARNVKTGIYKIICKDRGGYNYDHYETHLRLKVKEGDVYTFTIKPHGPLDEVKADAFRYQWQYYSAKEGRWVNSRAKGNQSRTLAIRITEGYIPSRGPDWGPKGPILHYRCKVSNRDGTAISADFYLVR